MQRVLTKARQVEWESYEAIDPVTPQLLVPLQQVLGYVVNWEPNNQLSGHLCAY